jgi:hypothetical protein
MQQNTKIDGSCSYLAGPPSSSSTEASTGSLRRAALCMVNILSDSMGEDFLIASTVVRRATCVCTSVWICFTASVRLEVGQAYFAMNWVG